MPAITILVISWVLGALAQSPHSISGFHYTGCSSIDISCFGDPVTFPDGCVTPEACQKACEGFQFAALLNEECRCGNDPKSITSKDESMCDHACQNNPALGCCGNSCPQDNPSIANVYEKEPALQQYTGPSAATAEATQSIVSAAAVSSQLITPAGQAPEPKSQSIVLPVSQSASTQSDEPCSPTQPSQYQTAQGQAPEPKVYDTSTVAAAQASVTNRPISAADVPQYETTMATKAASSKGPHGEPPIPSQVQGSDSAFISIPSLTSLGGLALIAVMIM